MLHKEDAWQTASTVQPAVCAMEPCTHTYLTSVPQLCHLSRGNPLPLQLSYGTEVPSMALSTPEAPSADSFNNYAQAQPAPERGVNAADQKQYSEGKDHQY